MATASCVIGVTILKSKDVNIPDKFFLIKLIIIIHRFHYIIWSFWKYLLWWLMLVVVLWDLVYYLDNFCKNLIFVIRCDTLDVINWNVFSIRTYLCFSYCYYSQLVIDVLYYHDICSAFCKLNNWKIQFLFLFLSMLLVLYYFLFMVQWVVVFGFLLFSFYLKHDVKHLNVYKF